ncbi:P-loop containing nucleoside triphosphate hydrolase protein [Amylostereum chailletii]|nr:P-loop containing nucleoside triphosphate hydrolase protein [Amylostereum chailletii]
MATALARLAKLNKRFEAVIRGKPVTPFEAPLFLQAICAQPDAKICVDKLTSKNTGLEQLQKAMFADLSLKALNAPTLRDFGGGKVLLQVLQKLASPSSLLDAYAKAFRAGSLDQRGQQSFAWVLQQLVLVPGDTADGWRELAAELVDNILSSPFHDVKECGRSIKNSLDRQNVGIAGAVHPDLGPGGRHDNDFADFRQIVILPTADEINCKKPPYLLTADVVDEVDDTVAITAHLDNQFRLLREDMMHELTEELEQAVGKKKGNHRGFAVENLRVLDVYGGEGKRTTKWCLCLQCKDDFSFFKKDKPKDRKKYLLDDRKLIKDQSLCCLLTDGVVIALATIQRDEDRLARNPPVICIQLEGEKSTLHALTELATSKNVKLIQVGTAVFSYEPVLKQLQAMSDRDLPLAPELFLWDDSSVLEPPPYTPDFLIYALENDPSQDISPLLGLPKPIILDSAQAASLKSGLKQRVSLIQGPPGTGKSFIGALLAKTLHNFSTQTILVCCYTNHALDQFLEDLIEIGIPPDDMVRLGGKATTKTDALLMRNQTPSSRFSHLDWKQVDDFRKDSADLFARLQVEFQQYMQFNISTAVLLAHIEFEDPDYYAAMEVSTDNGDGMQQIGSRGKAVDELYLLNRWLNGGNPGVFMNDDRMKHGRTSEIWRMNSSSRSEQARLWKAAILNEQISELYQVGRRYNDLQVELEHKFSERNQSILQSKRIIGCTTTAAAKYTDIIQAAAPNVLLVEEAGEILESHVLTALARETEQMILIGDHQQLRPKVNHYLLTVEKDEGYDLNMSLFERLVRKGYPHEALKKQHRMRPEISALIRHLTYPDLVDADKTQNRPNLLGVRDNLMLITHGHPEDEIQGIADTRDGGSKSSKQNTYEIQMVLKIVKYLAQQGYGTEDVVVLTPYLGQLLKLQQTLKNDTDPYLNDMDMHDLMKAGLIAPAAGRQKKRLRLATIDNYQGEESPIIVISLTRSNAANDIGFMFSPERVNVLLSRARNACIMIGNAQTFRKSKKGGDLWGRLIDLLIHQGHFYEGFPVRCERHPDRVGTLKEPHEFDEQCPNGGCNEPCGVILKCGVHKCPSKCHSLPDHSKLPCTFILESLCAQGHKRKYKCSNGPPALCDKCEKERKKQEQDRQEALELQMKREEEQRQHEQEIARLNREHAAELRRQEDIALAKQRDNAIRQKKEDIEAARARTAQNLKQATTTKTIPGPISAPPLAQPLPDSPSKLEWERQKNIEGASNRHIDAIMEMTGLEAVKKQILAIKARIEVTKRQGASMVDERFNIVLLGNPGTGKTTVARHYAKFLSSLGIVSGDAFEETTGSRMGNDGISGAEKLIEKVMKAGGGAIFVDEAYQLTGEKNIGGSQVLDFLLAEMENNVGKIVFILAGYNKQMEKFFEHNPGLTSRVPHRLQFEDYSDQELLHMFDRLIFKKYSGRMQVDDGVKGLYSRIAIRRLGRARGKEGFGNARALQNMFSRIADRQAVRIAEARKKGRRPDDMLFVKEDIIGPEPSKAAFDSPAWKKLQGMIGLSSVKNSIKTLFDVITENYQRELHEKEPIQMSLNRVFLGNPGTGKTTVAKLYGEALKDMSLLSNGEVVVKNPSDFMGQYIGQSEANTKAILASTIGKVLVIDEAYMLYGNGSQSGHHGDIFRTAVIDTIVAEIQSVPGEDRCVLLLGYEGPMREMFQNVNPGLSRRFAIEDAFRFEDYTDDELLQILELKLSQQNLDATPSARAVAIDILGRSRNRPNFGNGGEVENLLGKAKTHHRSRQASVLPAQRSHDIVFEPVDFDPDFDRAAHSDANLKQLFADVVGCEKVVEKLEGYQNIARVMRVRGKEPREARHLIPTNFVFKGPPGTGKTTTARKMGQVYYDMGFLSSVEVIECSASDLVGQYVGHTGPKTKKLFEKALGKVLFIDEAYRLSQGHFAKEAMDELVGILTQDEFRGKLIVILAGYDREMNELMAVNTGLSSRFPEEILFENLSPERCIDILKKQLEKEDIVSPELDQVSSQAYQDILRLVTSLSRLNSWGNARDMITLSGQMIRKVMDKISLADAKDAKLVLQGQDAVSCVAAMLNERRERLTNLPGRRFSNPDAAPTPPSPPAAAAASTSSSKKPDPASTPTPEESKSDDEDSSDSDSSSESSETSTVQGSSSSGTQRDPGVSDAIWEQLQKARRAADEAARRQKEEREAMEKALRETQERVKKEAARAQALARQAKLASDAEHGRWVRFTTTWGSFPP